MDQTELFVSSCNVFEGLWTSLDIISAMQKILSLLG